MIIGLFFITLVITVALLVGSVVGPAKSKNYHKWTYIGVGVCVVLFALCIILNGEFSSEVNELQAQYDDIMLYNEIVELSDNEQVRFGHYEKIEDFNEEYDRLVGIDESTMFGNLFPKDWSTDMSKIDFNFRGVN